MTLASQSAWTGSGDPQAELDTANKLLADEEYASAYREYLKYAESNELAQLNLGLFELLGWGRPVNSTAACHWFELSAAKDIPMAQELLGDCYRDGAHASASFDDARHWYTRAVENGLPQANCKLGKIYLDGTLIEKDIDEGLRLCEAAANGGALEAQLYLARRFEEGGEGIARDIDRALYWYRVAAAANNMQAQYEVARMLVTYGSDEEGSALALQLAETAAARGYRPAYLLTARLYVDAPVDAESRLPTPENLAKAYMWSQAAVRDSDDLRDKEAAEHILERVRSVMPGEWEQDLDSKVDEHFEQLKQ